MANEMLSKLHYFNPTCPVHAQEKLGIAPVFWKDETPAMV